METPNRLSVEGPGVSGAVIDVIFSSDGKYVTLQSPVRPNVMLRRIESLDPYSPSEGDTDAGAP